MPLGGETAGTAQGDKTANGLTLRSIALVVPHAGINDGLRFVVPKDKLDHYSNGGSASS